MSDQPASIGHNSVAGKQLAALIERIERLDGEKKVIADDIKDLYVEIKSTGFDTKVVRKIVRMRKQDQAKREEEAALTELYLHALGMV